MSSSIISKIRLDSKNNKYSFVFGCKYLNFTADCTLKDGQILTRTPSGDGRLEMSLNGEDIAEFLQENWKVLQTKVLPGLEILIKEKIDAVMTAVQENSSIEETFIGYS
ncbi:hemolymph juvenile hormone binding protein (JHBP) [Popillia japonica]|uniref:Hemolymph juvenile hormone binding protein (JHBP) n=1 Tax=Popillia japonica TaxID=7064 RepID=A0AAW1HUW8_POPJA